MLLIKDVDYRYPVYYAERADDAMPPPSICLTY